jgi:hypothetical protein
MKEATMKVLFVTLIAMIMPAAVFSQTRHNQLALGQTERQLIALSRTSVAKGVTSADIVVDDRFTGRSIAQVTSKTAELLNPKVTISGNRGLVTGRVIFKEGSPELRRTENSSPVTLSFLKHAGRWQLVNLCVGACSP